MAAVKYHPKRLVIGDVDPVNERDSTLFESYLAKGNASRYQIYVGEYHVHRRYDFRFVVRWLVILAAIGYVGWWFRGT
jgi:hypothetical protein